MAAAAAAAAVAAAGGQSDLYKVETASLLKSESYIIIHSTGSQNE